jgi:hypothetical protein
MSIPQPMLPEEKWRVTGGRIKNNHEEHGGHEVSEGFKILIFVFFVV